MQSGKLRHAANIEVVTETPDGMGGITKSWATWTTDSFDGTTKIGIYPISGKELIEAQKLEAKLTHKIKMRYISGLTPKHRIKFGTRIFKIHVIVNFQERNREFEIMAEEEVL